MIEEASEMNRSCSGTELLHRTMYEIEMYSQKHKDMLRDQIWLLQTNQ